jgi:transcription elongation factor GreA
VERALLRHSRSFPARLASALLQERLGENSAAGSIHLLLARDLAAESKPESARWLARRGLAARPDHRFVALLLELGEQLPDTAEEDREYARGYCPEAPELLWSDSERADSDGNADRAALLAVGALRGFAEIEDRDRAENALLRVLESDSPEVASRLLAAFPAIARTKIGKWLLEAALDLGLARIQALGLGRELVGILEQVLLRDAGAAQVRSIYVSLLTKLLGGDTAAGGMVRATGMPDDSVPFAAALERLRELSGYRPGTYVRAPEWGVGRVACHDGTALTIDFARKPGHKISLEIADTTLVLVSPESVQVALYKDPDGLREEKEQHPGELAIRALMERGGHASVKELKETLTSARVVGWEEWAGWWKRAREALKSDPRIDNSHAFRDVLSLRTDAPEAAPQTPPEDELALPPLDMRKGLKRAALVVSRLLEQHPGAHDLAKRHYIHPLTFGLSEERSADARLAVLPILAGWAPEQRARWVEEVTRAVEDGAGITDLASAEAQAAVLDLALDGDRWQDAAVGALLSRFPAVRDRAWSVLVDRSEDSLEWALVDLLSSDPAPASGVQLVSLLLERWGTLPAGCRLEPWWLLLPLLTAIDRTAPPKAAEVAQKMLEASDGVPALIAQASLPSHGVSRRLTVAVRRLAGQEALDVALALLDRTGHQALAERLTAAPEEEEVELDEDLSPERDPNVTLMARATYDRLKAQLRQMRQQLEAVLLDLERAREMGDISDNSEYDTAREQRAMLMASITSVNRDLEQAMFIETLDARDGVALPGTQVVYLDLRTGEECSMWLLGEGDSVYGQDVVSYKSPLGKAFVGARAGAKVVAEIGEDATDFEIVRVERRLPPAETDDGGA